MQNAEVPDFAMTSVRTCTCKRADCVSVFGMCCTSGTLWFLSLQRCGVRLPGFLAPCCNDKGHHYFREKDTLLLCACLLSGFLDGKDRSVNLVEKTKKLCSRQ